MVDLWIMKHFGKLACSTVILISSVAGRAAPAPPALPRVLLDTAWQRPSGMSLSVNGGGDLQNALDIAQYGDEIVLEAGATFSGNFLLRQKSGTGWITIRSSNLDSMPEGTRVGPSFAGSMAKIVTPNSSPVFAAEPGAHGYRLAGLEMTVQTDITFNYDLLSLGYATTDVSSVPSDIVVDRSYVHGYPNCDCKRGIALNGAREAVVDSYISDIHVHGQDSQAICGWSGPGPFKIVNNYLEGAGENVMFGGAPPDIADLSPSDIEFRRNYVAKPLAWMTGNTWTVKNLFELKNAARVLVDSNIFENNWVNAQAGTAILFQGLPSDSGLWAAVKDVTFTNNIVRHTSSGIATCGGCLYTTVPDPQTPRVIRIYVGNNLFEDLDWAAYGGVGGRGVQIYSRSSDLAFNHNTFFNTAYAVLLDGDPSPNVSFTANIMSVNQGGIAGSGVAPGLSTISQFLPNSTVTGNLLVALPSGTTAAAYPAGNLFPASMAAAGFTDYKGGNGGNYKLASSSEYRGTVSDGTDPGIDTTSLSVALQGVMEGTNPEPPSIPVLDIISPTAIGSFNTLNSTIVLSGTASASQGITSVTWVSDRGESGTMMGTTIWASDTIALQVGKTKFTVTAHGQGGTQTIKILTVSYGTPRGSRF